MELKYEFNQLHFFSINDDIDASNMYIPAFSSILNNIFPEPMVPIIGSEFSLFESQKRNFLILTSQDEKTKIEFPSNTIIITLEDLNQDKFKDVSFKILNAIDSILSNKISNRIGVINNKVFKGSNEQYKSLYNDLFTHRRAQPFEWDNRIVERLELISRKEKFNSLSSIRRLEAQNYSINHKQLTDIISVDVESNTIKENKDYRFSLKNCVNTFNELFENNKKLTSELNRYFKEC